MRYLLIFYGFLFFHFTSFAQNSELHQKLNIKAGGRIYVDYIHKESFENSIENRILENGMNISSTEIDIKGTVYQNVEFNFKTDFKGTNLTTKRAFIGYKNLPFIGTLRVGYQYEPFRFSALNSSKYSTFIGKTNNHYFSSKSNMGVVAFNSFFEDRFTVQFGLFQNGNNSKNKLDSKDGFAFTSRVVTLPYIHSKKKQLLHFGFGFSYRKPESKNYDLRIPFDSYFSLTNSTDNVALTNCVYLFNLEIVYIYKSFSFQSEYTGGRIQGFPNDFNIGNFYGNLSWILTGEQKKYIGGYNGFGEIQPKQNLNLTKKGWGAWEFAVGFSQTKLPERIFRNRKFSDFTLGFNWYLNPYSRIMFDFSHSDYGEKRLLNLFQARLQLFF